MVKTTLYKTDIYIDKVLVAWAKEVEFEADYNVQDEETHSGKMVHSSRYPGCDITITKLTKFESVKEQLYLDAVDKLAVSGGTVTMITKEPLGSLVITAYNCRPDSETWTNEAGEFLENELSLKAESFERNFV